MSPSNGLETTEASGTAVFTVVLDSQSWSSVTIGMASSDVGEGSISSPALVFSAGDWDVPQTVTVTGVDDIKVDGDITYTISTQLRSLDTNFHGSDIADVGVVNMDGTDDCSFVRPLHSQLGIACSLHFFVSFCFSISISLALFFLFFLSVPLSLYLSQSINDAYNRTNI